MATGSRAKHGRKWRGQSAEERRAERRDRLIEAGIELFGTRGYARSSVKAVCEQAGLTERYFYEAFDDREDLLAEIFGLLVAGTHDATLAAIQGSSEDIFARLDLGLKAFFEALTADSRKARIQEIEAVGVSEALETKRREALHLYAGLIADQVRREPGWNGEDRSLEVIALGMVGAVNEQLIEFVQGELDLEAEELLSLQKLMIAAVIRPLLTA